MKKKIHTKKAENQTNEKVPYNRKFLVSIVPSNQTRPYVPSLTFPENGEIKFATKLNEDE